MENRCIKCGKCCDFIPCSRTLEQIKNDPIHPGRDFILEHWVQLSEHKIGDYYRCICDWFDKQTRRCKHYDERPQICRDYFCERARK